MYTNSHMVGIMQDVGRYDLEMRLRLAEMQKITSAEIRQRVYDPVDQAHLPPYVAIRVEIELAAR